jgi:hypothetical protein
MTQWEYMTESGCSVAKLNELGKKKWELVSVFVARGFTVFYFKKEWKAPQDHYQVD